MGAPASGFSPQRVHSSANKNLPNSRFFTRFRLFVPRLFGASILYWCREEEVGMNLDEEDNTLQSRRPRLLRRPPVPAERMGKHRDIVAELSQRVIGQQDGLTQIVPFIHMFEAGLAPEGRPVG